MQVQTVVDDADEKNAEDRPSDATDPARQAGAADDHRGDGVEFIGLAGVGLSGGDPSGKDDPG